MSGALVDGRASFSRPPMPHNLEAEKCVLGSVLINDALLTCAAAILQPDDFFRTAHRRLFLAMLAVARCGGRIDLITVNEELGQSGELDAVGGPAYISALTDGVPRSANVEYYARIVAEKASMRRMIQTADEIVRDALDGRVDAVRAAARRLAAEDRDDGDELLLEPTSVLADRLAQQAADQPLVDGVIPAKGTSLFSGHPRSGKSLAALEIAAALGTGRAAFGRLAVAGQVPVCIVSEEDSAADILARLTAFTDGAARSQKLPIYVSAQRGLSLDDPRTVDRIIRHVSLCGAKLLMLDPIRSLSTCVDRGPAELAPLTTTLRRTMRETGTAVLLISHLVKPQPNDSRQGVHRVSGGGLVSIADAPSLYERVEGAEPLESVITPSAWKHTSTPSALRVRLTVRDGKPWRLVADDGQGTVLSPDDQRALDVLRSSPAGLSAYAVAERLGRRRASGPELMERLRAASLVVSETDGRGLRWRALEAGK
jgi:hypothetical protein